MFNMIPTESSEDYKYILNSTSKGDEHDIEDASSSDEEEQLVPQQQEQAIEPIAEEDESQCNPTPKKEPTKVP